MHHNKIYNNLRWWGNNLFNGVIGSKLVNILLARKNPILFRWRGACCRYSLMVGQKDGLRRIERLQQARDGLGRNCWDERVELNSDNYRNCLNNTFFKGYKSQSCSLKAKYVLCMTTLRHILLMSHVDLWPFRDPGRKINELASNKPRFESYWKPLGDS